MTALAGTLRGSSLSNKQNVFQFQIPIESTISISFKWFSKYLLDESKVLSEFHLCRRILKLTNTLTNLSEESRFNLNYHKKSIPIYIKNVSKNKLAKGQSENLRKVTNYPLIT